MMETYIWEGNEDLEISTQILAKEAFLKNLNVEVLDRKENFIRVYSDNKSEWIKEATKTSLDSYISFLIMENKHVSRRVLEDAGVIVPKGQHFESLDIAISKYNDWRNSKLVIKPTTTNFGLGIHILEREFSLNQWESSIKNAFSLSTSILIEEFIEGPEYRFLVLGEEVAAVCHRVPANVMGNGNSSILELVNQKNMDPRRGLGHKTPLEKIQTSPIEEEIISEQGYSWNSIPESGKIVYLRRNSNISTGGDSLDYTDLVHPEFKHIAVSASKAANSKICGVDIIAKSIEIHPDLQKYAILEINFNPVIYIHDFPFQGQNRRVGRKVLELLGF